jgi:hypothetical protein
MPAWVKNAIDAWTSAAEVTEGHLFRPVHRGDQVCGQRMSEKVVWQLVLLGNSALSEIRSTAYGCPQQKVWM